METHLSLVELLLVGLLLVVGVGALVVADLDYLRHSKLVWFCITLQLSAALFLVLVPIYNLLEIYLYTDHDHTDTVVYL